MRTFLLLLAILGSGIFDSAWCADAGGKPSDPTFLRGFLSGEYDLIGRRPDSSSTYTGRVTLVDKDGVLQVTRTVDGKTVRGTMKFDTVGGADRIPVLRVRFRMDGREYEATYLWQSDLDNYPRLTGYIYLPGNRTKSPGLEAFFPIHR